MLDAPPGTVAGQVFNVAPADASYALLAIAESAVRACGGDVQVGIRPVAGDARDYRATGGRLTAAAGWAPARGLDEGIAGITGALAAGVLGQEAGRTAA